MTPRHSLYRSLFGLAAIASAALLLGNSPERAPSTSRDLGGADRYLTHLSTDKPIYRPGESVYIRGVLLHVHTGEPLQDGAQGAPMVEVKGPKGDTVASGFARIEDSVAAFAWEIPRTQPGGEYTIRLSYPYLGHAPAERKVDVRAYRSPRLKSQIVFLRDGYGPGDEVVASVRVERAEGGVPEGAKVEAIASLDGEVVHRGETTVGAGGIAEARFRLPGSIERGDGTLAFVIEDGGAVETAAKTIPILLQTIDLSFYPEGGELIAGLPGRVYVEARTPAGKPADLRGRIVDGRGMPVAMVATHHEGRGRFAFTPLAGETYQLEVLEPSGIERKFPLPEVLESGAVLLAAREAYREEDRVVLQVASTREGPLTVTLSKREQEVARAVVDAGSDLAPVELTPPATATGVLVATLYDSDQQPLAERLIFRRPSKAVEVRIEADRTSYVPGQKVVLNVETRNEKGEPVSAVVGLAITDDSVLELVEKREQAPRLPAMVLLENDVRELADAHVYLDPENLEAPQALDLLLGTQGWRRFAFIDTANFLEAHGDAARRVLALRMATRRELQTWHLRRSRGGLPVPEAAARPEGIVEKGEADGKGAVEREAAGAERELLEAEVPAGAARPALQQEAQDVDGDLELGAREALEVALEDARAGIAAKRIARDQARIENRHVTVIRVYAHAARPDRKPGDRRDFTETLYWNAAVRTAAETGRATFEFDLSDSVTAFRVTADAFDARGALGSASETLESVEPFYIEPKLPLEVTQGDLIEVPLAIANGTGDALDGGAVTVVIQTSDGKEHRIGEPLSFELAPRERKRLLVPLRIQHLLEGANVVVSASCGPYADRVVRPLRIVPRGFPAEVGEGGLLAAGGRVSHTVVIPEDLVEGSLSAEVVLYPTPLASLTQALERLLQEPYGCFEQTSSTTYPLIMAQQYFQSHSGVDPLLIARAAELLEKGYQRLTGFECKERGYEWFGQDPGHEALTAYGLLEFTDMAKVRQVDAEMLARTRQWLLASRDGKGSFRRERRALHTWIEDRDCSNGYILWSLLEAGEPAGGISREIEAFLLAASRSANSYVHALGALVALGAGNADAPAKFMERLAASQESDGHVGGATTSIVGSGGDALKIETTALAVLAWLSDAHYAGNVEKGMRWLAESCKAGRFGSTQSTVLALRAIVEYDRKRSRVERPGKVRVFVDGHRMGDVVSFDERSQSAILLPDISEMLFAGRHVVELEMEDGSELPYGLAVRYHRTLPDSSRDTRVGVEIALARAEVKEGEVTEAKVTVTNRNKEAVPTPVAIAGIPGGLEVRHDQLKELVAAGRVAAYEVIGREVVLYWRALEGNAQVEVPLSLVAAVPGSYTGPASRAYLYYTDEHKDWDDPLAVTITPGT